MKDQNPYAPGAELPERFESNDQPEGSFTLGAVLGFLFGLWGWLGCLLLAKAETKRGAGIGFLSRILITVVILGLAMVFA